MTDRSLPLLVVASLAAPLAAQEQPRPARPARAPEAAVRPREAYPAPWRAPRAIDLLEREPLSFELPIPIEPALAPFAPEPAFPSEPAFAVQAPQTPRPAWPDHAHRDAEWPIHEAPDIAAWHPDHPGLLDPHGTPRGRLLRQEPKDTLYRRARELLNRGEYRRAAELFHQYQQQNPDSRYTATAMYYRAFALYRAGTDADLRLALRVLDEQRERFDAAARDQDVAALVTRVTGALASRGNAEAARRLREGAVAGAPTCDREDMEVRAEALTALVQSDAASSTDLLRRILARRDECTAPLRRRAVYLLGRDSDPGHADLLLDIARNDPSERVRADAVVRLAQIPGSSTVSLLERLFDQAGDESTQRAVLHALRRVDDPGANALLRRMIEREDATESLRADAVRMLGRATPTPRPAVQARRDHSRAESGLSDSDAVFLRSVYSRTQSRAVRSAILETIARSGGPTNDQWLMGIVRNQNEELRYRSAALGRLRRADVSIEELGRLYDALTERELRATMVAILGVRDEPEATDKLLEIAKTGTDPSIRRMAINALARKKDERTTKLLLELVEK